MLIDTHCHLNFKAYKKNVREVIESAKKIGVEKIVVPGAKLNSSRKAVELAQQYEGIYAAIGIHPHHAGEEIIKHELMKLAKNKKVVAIGECGLDYFPPGNEKIDKKAQKNLFLMQLEIAHELHLPVIIHNRDADEDILKILTTHNSQLATNPSVFHCFMGNFNLLKWALDNGFYIGITGLVTYNKHVQEVVKLTPLNRLLIETDSPFLTPEPLRSQKNFPNKPENVKIVAEWIAKIKSDSFLNVAKQTTANALRLFKLIKK